MSPASHHADTPLVAVRPDRKIDTAQGLPYFVGISAQTAGATGLSMHIVVIPPGGHATPHIHVGFETAVYVLEGRVETHYGPGLRQTIVTGAGEFLFIPPGVPHQAFNVSDTTAVRALIARNAPGEHETVQPYDPADDA